MLYELVPQHDIHLKGMHLQLILSHIALKMSSLCVKCKPYAIIPCFYSETHTHIV